MIYIKKKDRPGPEWFKKFLHTPMGYTLNKNGPWLAGGAARKAFFGEPIGKSDIDIFFNSRGQYNQICRMLNLMPNLYKFFDDSNRTIPYKHPVQMLRDFNDFDVQIIPFDFQSSAEMILSNFDFTVAQFAFDGEKFLLTPEAVSDAKEKILKFSLGGKNSPSFQRIDKYVSYGFTLSKAVETHYDQLKVGPYISEPVDGVPF